MSKETKDSVVCAFQPHDSSSFQFSALEYYDESDVLNVNSSTREAESNNDITGNKFDPQSSDESEVRNNATAATTDIATGGHNSQDELHRAHNDYFQAVIQQQIPLLEVKASQNQRRLSPSRLPGVTNVLAKYPVSIESLPPPPPNPSQPNNTLNDISLHIISPSLNTNFPQSLAPLFKTQPQEKPKRARTAYIIFLEDFRDKYFEQFPNAKYNDCQKFAGLRWKAMSAAEKLPWKELEQISQKEFIRKMHELQTSFGLVKKEDSDKQVHSALEDNPVLVTQSSHQDKAGAATHSVIINDNNNNSKTIENAATAYHMQQITSSPPPPQRRFAPRTYAAFSLFVEAMRGEAERRDPHLTYNDIQKQLSMVWRNLPAHEKEVWKAKSRKLRLEKGLDSDCDPKRVHAIALPKGPR